MITFKLFRPSYQRQCPHEFYSVATYFPSIPLFHGRRYDMYCPTCNLRVNFVHYRKFESLQEIASLRAKYDNDDLTIDRHNDNDISDALLVRIVLSDVGNPDGVWEGYIYGQTLEEFQYLYREFKDKSLHLLNARDLCIEWIRFLERSNVKCKRIV